ncbi:GNAT family N-acetyltransferase [Clostridiaceae bacterium M8S5]|nr:GNAT family N-acetyltransferase [Clostridiaceae bacterium M8S5]
MNISFKEINKENWEECINLDVRKEQEKFVASNWYSILEAKFGEKLYPLCIYDNETMIGFLMYDFDPETGRWELSRFMIDKKYQRKGYGKMSMIQLVNLMKEKLGNIKFYLSIEPKNLIAQKLYESIGFKKTGEIMWDEEVMVIEL